MIHIESGYQIGPTAVLGILKKLDGLDFANGAHIISKIVIRRSGRFCKYLKLCEQSTVDIWCPNRFGPFKQYY